ncbi:MAG: Uma2 family endonuclease [Bernardetiaceae bacterium]
MEATLQAPITAAAYLDQEAQASNKSEYYAGQVIAMAGAQEPHNLIVANLLAELVFCLKKKECRVYASDQLVYLPEGDRYVYPDISVVCQKPDLQKHRGIDVLLNPTMIVEVISSSTELLDKGAKLEAYLCLASLQTYALVDSRRVYAQVYSRQDTQRWTLQTSDQQTDTLSLDQCPIKLEEVYRLVF